jgi:hypothetical protein
MKKQAGRSALPSLRPSSWPRRTKILIWLVMFSRAAVWRVLPVSDVTMVVVAAPFKSAAGVRMGAFGWKRIALCVQPGAVSLVVGTKRLAPGTVRLLGSALEIATGLPLISVWQQ